MQVTSIPLKRNTLQSRVKGFSHLRLRGVRPAVKGALDHIEVRLV